ncbi:DUF397 domain-containing protein [Yinghuangia sp. YIM S09857]|uniref:DUF397 domain-containing protein n=1 Tax=Yinghuangia sp. YIM S09857 TaxID=3436929 RepID=UPI003F5321B1
MATQEEMEAEKAELYARDISGAEWISYGEDTTGEGVVQTAEIGGGAVAMRNSAHPEGPILRFTKGEWDAFVLGVKDGEFDLERLAEPPVETS